MIEPRRGSVADALREMGRVIHALIVREMRTRFGRQRLGYIWALLEPIMFVSVLAVLFTLRGRYHPPGMTLVLFLITGIVPFFLFRHAMTRGMRAIEQNKALLAYPQVQIMDIALARFLLELGTSIVVFVLLVWGVHLLRIEPVDIEAPLGVAAGIAMMGLFGFGLGLFFGSLSPLFRDIEPIVQAALGRPLFFVSGVFYSIEMIPYQFREFLLINPLFHVLEWLRSVFFVSYDSRYVDMDYVLWVLIGLLFIGLVSERALRRYAFAP